MDASAEGGRYKFNAMSQERVEEEWVSLSSLPPKEAIVAVVLNDIVNFDILIDQLKRDF